MPLRNEPKSLKETCMIKIANNFDLLCYNCKNATGMNKMVESEAYLNVKGPFEYLPCNLLTDMMSVIEGPHTTKYLHRKHLHHLILPHIENIKLSPMSASHTFGINLITSRCKRLRSLDLSYLSHVSPLALIRLIPTLHQILFLNFSMTEITDQILSLIGKHCLEIRDLNVSQCPITNHGIYSLCYDAEEKKIQCTKLQRLNVTGCMITTESLVILLQKIPTLKHLDYENTFRIFGKIPTKNKIPIGSQEPIQVYSLQQLNASDDNINPYMENAIQMCPLTTSVAISNCIISNESLYRIMTLESLSQLRFTNNDNQSIDFYEGILPILTVCGHRLETLLLVKFTMIDIAAIGECCPNLRNFAMSNISVFEELLYPKDSAFRELTALEVWTDVYSESVSPIILKQVLLFCPNLQNLLISGSSALNDKLMEEILKVNHLTELSRLTIDNCPNISCTTFQTLLDLKNKLTLVRIWSCFSITREESLILHRKIKKENCDTYLEWHAWFG
ncbi:UNVERIFIED_CONTAM: hypothetical protein RMT77_002704 [Armadillidium vulgare]